MEKLDHGRETPWTKLAEDAGIEFTAVSDPFFTYLSVSPAALHALMGILKQRLGMNYLADITAVDHGSEFEVVYHLYAIPDNGRRLAIKTRIAREAAVLESAFPLYPTADWQEREIYDLMGISFSNHPNLARVLLPDDFKGHPLRKDYRKEGG
ncbi:MAG: NADH-quinone oxidoreductase subunit C [Syntrophomonadaceae bacterium]|nr:NADH-quinone oxidoreductase subunit C [Syntrophomonadaceae bacterium]